jgi:hypothetical protein
LPVGAVEEVPVRGGHRAVGSRYRVQADQDAGPVGQPAFSVDSADALEAADEYDGRKVVQRLGDLALDSGWERLPRLVELVQRAAGALDGAVDDEDSLQRAG